MKKCIYTLALLCVSFISFSQNWLTTGNSGTTMSNFLGTTDSKSLRFRTNNTQVAILDSTGKLGIGIAIPSYNLDVNGNTRISSTLQIGSSTSYPASTVFNAFGGVTMMHFSQGQSSVSPTLSIYNTNSSAKALSLLVGTSGTATIFDSTGWYGIGAEPKSNISGGLPTGGKLYYKMFADGQSIFSTSSVSSTTAQSANLSILNTQSSSIVQLIRSASVQNVDLTQWRDFSGNVLARVDKAGKASFKGALYLGYTNSSLLTDTSFVPRKYVDSLSLVQAQSGWKLTGNTGINPATTFIGTTDNQPLLFKTNNTEALRINSSGNVGIGSSNLSDTSYRLFVEKGIRTRKIKVDLTTWADYVFEPDYSLPALKDVENYIRTHKHLPEMPSAQQVEDNGLDLGANQTQLLKKIEELTLYAIEQNKKMEEITLQTIKQDKQIQLQQQQINELLQLLKKK